MTPPNSCTFRLTSVAGVLTLSIGMALSSIASGFSAAEDLSELSLEELMKVEVSSASKFPQSTSHAPSAVQVLTADDIRRHGWNTLAEALDSLPGMYASTDRAFGFLGARGFMVPGDYNMRFLLLLDGEPLNDNLYGQANLGHEFRVDMGMIERIEYVPGPGSSVYGANAMFGVINVITRSAKSLPGLRVGTSFHTDGWRELNMVGSHRGEHGGPELVFSLSRANKTGQDLTYPDAIGLQTSDGSVSTDGVAHKLDSMMVTRAFAGLKQAGFALSAWAARRDVHPSSALYGSNFDDRRLHLIDSSYGLAGAYQKVINDQLNFNARLAYQRITYQGDSPYLDEFVGSYVNRDQAIGSWVSGELRLLYTGLDQHKLIAGVDFRSDLDALQKNADLDVNVNVPLSINTRANKHGVFLQDEWNFSPDWRLNAGVRNDRYSRGDSDVSPRLALIWNASPNSTLKLLAGRAYRVANAYEADYARDPYYLANKNLAPETIRTIEAVAEYRFAGNQEIGASLFDYRLKNLIQQVDTGDGVFQYRNQSAVSVNGLELFFKLRQKNGFNLVSSLALNRSRDRHGDELVNSPHWIAKLRASKVLFGERFIAAVEVNAIGSRRAEWRGISSQFGTQTQVNLAMTAVRLAAGMDLQLRLVNVFDQKIVHPASDESGVASLPMDGRQWQLGLNYAF